MTRPTPRSWRTKLAISGAIVMVGEWVCGDGSQRMPRPKGPEKVAFKVMVTIPTFERLTAKAKGKPVGTYIAEREERATIVDEKRNGEGR
jgi:hypothetical protein